MCVRRSGRAIIVREGHLALLRRDRAELTYYVFPGGGVEHDETPEEAAIREAHEELGVTIRSEQLVAVIRWHEHEMYFYQATIVGGRFGSGHGPEFRSHSPETGTYRPVWLHLQSLPDFDVRPKEIADALVNGDLLSRPAPLNLTISGL
jgi:8-oxo-dGTP diphosphatase